MQAALLFLLGLIILCPVLLFVDNLVIQGIILLWTAAAFFLAFLRLPLDDLAFFWKMARPFLLVALLPAFWLIIQMLPIFPGVSPDLLGTSGGHALSVNPGGTALALVFYLLLVGVMALTCMLSINRKRAESILIAATCAAVFISCLAIAQSWFGSRWILLDPEQFNQALDCACLGLILTAACLCLIYERHETRPDLPGHQGRPFQLRLTLGIVAFLICLAAILLPLSGSLLFAAIIGIGGFSSVVLVRRLALGRMGAAAIALTSSIIALVLIAGAAEQVDPRLAFVRKSEASLALTQQLLRDAPFLGTGAGTLPSLLPIYQSLEPGQENANVVTAAARFSIEMGRPSLWFMLAAAALTIILLLWGGWRRGRDSFYATAGAASVAVLMILSFVNNGLYGSSLLFLASIVLGLALAQRESRRSG